jgi:quinoprotein glucose dehydrogenase
MQRLIVTAVALLLGLVALTLLVGGGMLIAVGGSPYYLIAGLAVAASSITLIRHHSTAPVIYGLLVLSTLIWSLWEAGLDGWALAPRLLGPALLGLLFLLPPVRRHCPARRRWTLVPTLAVVATLLFSAAIAAYPEWRLHPTSPPSPTPVSAKGTEWRHWGNTIGGTRYVPVAQIDTANVQQLKLAWQYDSHRPAQAVASFEATPLAADGRLYVCLQPGIIAALDQDTGGELWRYTTPDFEGVNFGMLWSGKCRGVSYYEVPHPVQDCQKRILFWRADGFLMAVDAANGRPCSGFGTAGAVDMKVGMGDVGDPHQGVLALPSSPPAIVNGIAVIGQSVSDLLSLDAPSGVVRGYDAETGELRWAWDAGRPAQTLLRPGETYTRDTPNAWGVLSGDERLGLVFVPTGNSLPDYFGGARWPWAEGSSSAIVAIDVSTGKVRWTFQTVHHDLWDYDVGAQPVAVDLPGADGPTPALLVPTKLGEIFVLDRRTGVPIDTVVERPAPRGGVPEEHASPTQPHTTGFPSLDRAALREQDMWGMTPLDAMWCRILFKRARYEGAFTPAATRDTIFYPGTAGGIDWGSVSVDAEHGLVAVNTLRFANLARLIPRQAAPTQGGGEGGTVLFQMAGTPYAFAQTLFMSPLGVPCQPPPYGTMNVLDLNTRQLVWSKPLGTAVHSGPFGLSSHLPIRMGVPNMGGSVVTAGGLVFIGATQDRMLRAFDLHNGRELWHAALPSVAVASPMSYVSARTGIQYVVIASGGHYGIPGPTGGSLFAYALPRP